MPIIIKYLLMILMFHIMVGTYGFIIPTVCNGRHSMHNFYVLCIVLLDKILKANDTEQNP